MNTRRLISGMLLIGVCCIPYMGLAQEDACPAIVDTALAQVDSACDALGRNQACYGHRLADIEPYPGAAITFDEPGDLAGLESISRLQTMPLNLATGEWGIVVLKVQANLPDTLPGQNVTFLLTGAVTLEDVSEATGDAPMQRFYFNGGIGESDCVNAPDSLVIQTPTGTHVTLNINGVDVELGSTAVLSATPNDALDILMVGGEATVTASEVSQTVPAGEFTSVGLGGDDGLSVVSAPSAPATFDPARIQGVPLNLLPETVEVPSSRPWTDTGIALTAGQQFFISASGTTNTCGVGDNPNCVNDPSINRWVGPEGNPAWETCEGQYGECPLMPGPYAALVGQVGDGQPFLVGSGGDFVADASGVLQLGYNDHRYDDNAGSYFAIVTAKGEAVASPGETVPVSTQCSVTASGNVNLRSGPGTGYARAGGLAANESASPTGQAMGVDGYVWWQLANGNWVRSDVVNASGDCDGLPVVSDIPPTPIPAPIEESINPGNTRQGYVRYYIEKCNTIGRTAPIRAGDQVRFEMHCCAAPTVEENEALLAGHTVWINLDGVPLSISYTDTEPVPNGFTQAGWAMWTATLGTHTVSGNWTRYSGANNCTVTVQ